MSDFEAISKAATEKGMYLVDHSNIVPLLSEYSETLAETAKLCDVTDPMETPYLSKYKARELLDSVANKLEATKTILSLEGKKDVIREEIAWRYAAIQVRLGTIAWEVEEPHNTQTDLEPAVDFYFPGLREQIEQMSSTPSQCDGDLPAAYESVEEDVQLLPSLVINDKKLSCDILKCLNMLGILWAGRDQVKKSFLYLHSAKVVYDSLATETTLSESDRQEVESLYTHNLFYLAQAYGHIGRPVESCRYCHETLNRQLQGGLAESVALEWVKNCMGIADFHMAISNFKRCAYSLCSAEEVLSSKVLPLLTEGCGGIYNDWRSGALEIEADLHRRWLRLEVTNLKRSVGARYRLEEAKAQNKYSSSSTSLSSQELELCEQFSGLKIIVPPMFYDVTLAGGGHTEDIVGIRTPEEATVAFKRGFARADAAKKILVLDGQE